MAHVLDRILAVKRREVEEAKSQVPQAQIERLAGAASPPRGFERALRERIAKGEPAVIAEIKRASPSKGLIRADFDAAAIGASYAANGAACLSVLTDREFFQGSREYLEAARTSSGLPVLRKDFMIDPYQVYEARSWGADCILLIMDAATDTALLEMASLANALGMGVLVESHDGGQLDRALKIPKALIGINNRNLRTFETRLETTIGLVDRVPAERLLVTESGIEEPSHVARLKAHQVSAYLVGGALMAAPDPGRELRRLFFSYL